MVLDNLENTGTLALPGLGVGRFPADLHQVERVSEIVYHLMRKIQQIVFRRPDPMKWLFRKCALHHEFSVYLFRYNGKKESEPHPLKRWSLRQTRGDSVIVVGTTVHRIVLTPLATLTDAARGVSEGDYTVKLSSERKDEIGTLTRAFSEMSVKVRDHAENLELRVQERTTQLNETNLSLHENMEKLEDALTKVKTLSSMLPICASCKKIRDDKGSWCNIETYILEHTGTEFSHGICPECSKKLYPEYSNDDR
ncbi:MAG: HAMP domain-containing protein [Deltaproteobacteria bacterium]|nr:MAG: HAMP domain-containing protein [Deltaproteobacteria bacterium]